MESFVVGRTVVLPSLLQSPSPEVARQLEHLENLGERVDELADLLKTRPTCIDPERLARLCSEVQTAVQEIRRLRRDDLDRDQQPHS